MLQECSLRQCTANHCFPRKRAPFPPIPPTCLALLWRSPSQRCLAQGCACAWGRRRRPSQAGSSGRQMPVSGPFGCQQLCPLPFSPGVPLLSLPPHPTQSIPPCLSTGPGPRAPWERLHVSLQCFTWQTVLCDS